MPVSPGAVLPREMNATQWSTFLSQSGIQGDRTVKKFTPTWTGFSVDPVGEISYYDFGAIVIMWVDAQTTGTSGFTSMGLGSIPAAITPSGSRLFVCWLFDSGLERMGTVHVTSSSTIIFGLMSDDASPQISKSHALFTASGSKGLPEGWLIMYAK